MALLQDKICKVCQTELVWEGSLLGGKMKCPNLICASNKTWDTRVSLEQKYPTAEELEYDAADD